MNNDDAANLVRRLEDAINGDMTPEDIDALTSEARNWRLERELTKKAKTSAPQTADPSIQKGFLATKGTLALNEQDQLGVVIQNTRTQDGQYLGTNIFTGDAWYSSQPRFLQPFKDFLGDSAVLGHFHQWVDAHLGTR